MLSKSDYACQATGGYWDWQVVGMRALGFALAQA